MSDYQVHNDSGNELYNAGFTKGEMPCPDCGAFLWTYDLDIFLTGDEGDEPLTEMRRECDNCGYSDVSYDA